MQLVVIRADRYDVRTALIYVALVCLCLSDGVGPRLVPYPATHGVSSGDQAKRCEATERDAKPDADEYEIGNSPFAADDAFEKLSVFSASETFLIQSPLAHRSSGGLNPSETSNTLTHLYHGRAPPRIV